MSGGADWHDPFAEDEEALARERRRAEREVRRRGAQASLAGKVAEQRAGSEEAPAAPATPAAPSAPATEAAPSAPAETEVREAAPPSTAAPTARPADAAISPPTDEQTEVEPPAERPLVRSGLATGGAPPADAEGDPEQSADSAEIPVIPPPVRRRSPEPRPHGGASRRQLQVRRIGAIVGVVALVAIVGLGASKVIDRLGGGEEAPVQAAPPLKVQDVTIPEGLDRRQIAEIAKKAGLKGDYVEATEKAPKGFELKRYGAAEAPNLEGFLFPATYELEKKAGSRDLVAKQLDAFGQNLAQVDLSYAKSKNLTTYDVLKIASMVEREIQVPEERKLAAAVIYNRLAAGDTLGIDATIRYEDHNYDEQLLESRLNTDTPYNTRTRPGLPPTPIGNPGLASIEAAANPAKSDVYYFVVKPGTCGEHVFVETEEEFAEAEAEYQEALQAEGGSPTDC